MKTRREYVDRMSLGDRIEFFGYWWVVEAMHDDAASGFHNIRLEMSRAKGNEHAANYLAVSLSKHAWIVTRDEEHEENN